MFHHTSSSWSAGRLGPLFLPLAVIACGNPVAAPSFVSPPPPPNTQPAPRIRVEPGGANLRVAETIALRAILLFESDSTPPTVSWSTSDANVASVSPEGLVTARAPGSVIVTAMVAGFSASSVVRVKNSNDPDTE